MTHYRMRYMPGPVWRILGIIALVALVLSILNIAGVGRSTSGVNGTDGVTTINGISPASPSGNFLMTGNLGISVVSDTNGVIIQNDATIALVEPAEFIVSGSPLNGNGGTITISKATQSANTVWAGPSSGSPAVPTFRALTSSDMPSAMSLSTLTVTGDVFLGGNTSCMKPILPSCYDISNQQCLNGPLQGNCLPANAMFDNLVVNTLTIINGTDNNGTSLNNTILGTTFLTGPLTCSGNGSISNGCLNLGGYTCPIGIPLAESCIPASLVMYDLTVTNNLTVNQVTCAGGPIPSSCIPSLNASSITSGILLVSVGGTGSGTALNNDRIMVSNGGAIIEGPALTDGQLLIGSTGAAPVAATLTAGSGISIVNGAGSITISATAANVVLDANASPTAPDGTNTKGVWYGLNTQANAFDSSTITIGNNAITGALNAVAIGTATLSNGSATIAIGLLASASGGRCISIGPQATCSIGTGVAIGDQANANVRAIAIGGNVVSTDDSVSVGYSAEATGIQSTAISNFATASAQNALAIGNQATAGGQESIAIGYQTVASLQNGIGMGAFVTSTANSSIAIGAMSLAIEPDAIAIGRYSTISASTGASIAIGAFASNAGVANSICLNAAHFARNPFDTAHAFSLGLNSASVNPGSFGLTINQAPFQLPLYTSLYATTATTGGTTTLTVTSAKTQRFSGTLSHTVILPNVTSLANGFSFYIINDSTGTVTVQTGGGNILATLTSSNSGGTATVVNVAGGTGIASWHWGYDTVGPVVLDSSASPTFPTTGDSKGVWHGLNTKTNAFDSSTITIGNNATTGAVNAIVIGTSTIANGDSAIAIGTNAVSSGASAITIGSSLTNAIADSAIIGMSGNIYARFETPGTVTQATSLTTGVTINAAQGKITLFSTLVATSSTRFTVTNNRVKAASVITATVEAVGGTLGLPTTVGIMSVVDGSFDMILYNADSGATTNAPIVHFNILSPAI